MDNYVFFHIRLSTFNKKYPSLMERAKINLQNSLSFYIQKRFISYILRILPIFKGQVYQLKFLNRNLIVIYLLHEKKNILI